MPRLADQEAEQQQETEEQQPNRRSGGLQAEMVVREPQHSKQAALVVAERPALSVQGWQEELEEMLREALVVAVVVQGGQELLQQELVEEMRLGEEVQEVKVLKQMPEELVLPSQARLLERALMVQEQVGVAEQQDALRLPMPEG